MTLGASSRPAFERRNLAAIATLEVEDFDSRVLWLEGVKRTMPKVSQCPDKRFGCPAHDFDSPVAAGAGF